MILDYLQKFCADLAITSTGLATDVLDNEEVGAHQGRMFGDGETMGVMISIDAAPDGTTGDETYSLTVETSAAAAITSATVLATQAIPRATAAGTKYFLTIPPGQTLLRYLGVRATLGGTTPTLTYTAYLMSKKAFESNFPYYTSGFSIS